MEGHNLSPFLRTGLALAEYHAVPGLIHPRYNRVMGVYNTRETRTANQNQMYSPAIRSPMKSLPSQHQY